MEVPPSRSSSTSDCKSLCLPPLDSPDAPPTPDSIDAGSEASWRPASSSPCSLMEAPRVSLGLGLGLGLGLSPGVLVGGTSWRERAQTESSLRRLLPTLDALLQQLDRVNMATDDVYHIECRLERTQRKRRRSRRERGEDTHDRKSESKRGGKGDDKDVKERRTGKEKHTRGRKEKKTELPREPATKKTPVATPIPFSKPRPTLASAQPHISQSSATDKPTTSTSTLHNPPSKTVLVGPYNLLTNPPSAPTIFDQW
ncbi:uncharacterized protein LOC122829451 [Gambusia affinis]|uniref:uncharacterized protein LOC122829451 n=1 Tax=Gambusia affinis TaxID=33528 RepID=UPI001CDD2917|nr:uncharacterized protein LOC122829451 [Gambusia affinis]XP_043969948.1 uncharacterized protein LOC122829451 [Gambusia affinis]XP_043969949.1 uncharacterized protein LOC122829451 [Gambusia affinis]XP_043969950.1 uncharacterized protein LOC122829451 [Gambusia affinis]XP_043969951.1 uncharacterized protein LOC122829451 [Gambusia affinis]